MGSEGSENTKATGIENIRSPFLRSNRRLPLLLPTDHPAVSSHGQTNGNKPVRFDAFQWTGSCRERLLMLVEDAFRAPAVEHEQKQPPQMESPRTRVFGGRNPTNRSHCEEVAGKWDDP
jgi:hypothetical protein